MPKISVIIPTYGMPVYLKKSILSVINQTIDDWELIVVDDNDPDTEARIATERLVSAFCKQDPRITYINHERNKNGAAARNTGIKAAHGEYIAFLDSDDEYMPTRFEKCLMAMENTLDNVAGVYTGCEFRHSDKVYHVQENVESGNFLVETLACTFHFCTGSNIFVKKSAVDSVKGFDEAFLRHQDYEFLVRIFEKYTLKAIPQVLVIKNNENRNLPNVEKMIEIKAQYLQKYQYILEGMCKDDTHYIYSQQYYSIAEAAIRSHKRSIASKYFKMARKYRRVSLKQKCRFLIFFMMSLFGIEGK